MITTAHNVLYTVGSVLHARACTLMLGDSTVESFIRGETKDIAIGYIQRWQKTNQRSETHA